MAKHRRKLGSRRLSGKWTSKRAHAFCMARMGQIELILQEIASTYDDVDQTVVAECDRLRDEELPALGRTLDEALEEGR
ncbi:MULTISPECIES: hypothetical protein [unclassified Shinella]|uniref:hypothetical protein n=1 Tax=unclassified Shinella TaxID=2643062 RepID=UPI00225D4798|nr:MULTISPECIES: hypothetical protein [unclassified Shinella]MCO5139025.1 hypothetical protein [Shinella sp.]MDC7256246.1 hypothetical protein [Shinella sp. YE25]CAI0339103.1 conserved hypothetical protein [Rhizobiaceae bacterium]CAK7257519.1 conserved protein of unknown function [Shinella sp. WSC3-e]